MRIHCITCHIEGEKPTDQIQYLINYFAAAHLESAMKRDGLSKDEQIAVLSGIIRRYQIRNSDTEDINDSGR